MKKSLPIILLSVFTLAFSAVGFLGIQPVKAATEVAGITIEDGAVGYEGVSITHADQATNEDGDAVSSGEGKMKFYSSLTQDLYNSLQGKDFKTGTLIIPAELLQGESVADKLNTLDITKVGVNGAINVDTTNVWTLYDVDDDKEENDVDDAYWAMASLYNIPRAYYGVPMAARSYLAVKGEGDADYTYVYSATNDVTDFYSLTTTALKKLEAGDYDEKEDLKTAITNDYTTFKVTFHFNEINKEFAESKGYTWTDSATFNIPYGRILPSYTTVLDNTAMELYASGTYRYSKGFYNYDQSVHAVMLGAAIDTDDVTNELLDYKGNVVNSSAYSSASPYYLQAKVTDNLLTKVYGDMNLYEVAAPANLVDDFATADTVSAAFGRKEVTEEGKTGYKYEYSKAYALETAGWLSNYTDKNGVTEEGVLTVPSQFMSTTDSTGYTPYTRFHNFQISSALRNRAFFFGNYGTASVGVGDRTADNYYKNTDGNDFDYVNFRVLVTTTTDLTEVPLQFYWGGGNYGGKNPSTIPVNTWVNLYFDRNLSMERYSAYHAAAERLPQSARSALEIDTTDIGSQYNQEGMFTLYVDYISYDRDMRIAVNGVDGYSLVDYADTSGVLTPYAVSYSKVTSKLKQEVTLSTALTNGTINYTVLDPDGEEVVLTNGNTFTPTKLGSYTVKASCDDYVLQIADTAEISGYSYKSKQYGELVFEVVGAEIDVTMAETATIGINESVEITAVTNAEYTLSYSAKLPNGDLIELDSNVLPIGLVGDYEVYVTAYDSENFAVGKQTLPLTVKAMTAAQVRDSGIFATFGQDGSEKAAYGVTATYTTKWVFDWTGKGDATSIANGTLSDGTTTWKADWHDKYQGRYGVISTRSQFAGYDTTTSYGVFLRSDVVLTTTYNQPFCGGDYNTSQARKEGAFNNTNWDYLSIPIYLPKPANATEDYTNVYLRYAVGGAIQVPYDTWYELKIDKYWLMINYYDQAGYIFRYGASNGYPLFFMSLANASEDALKLAQDQEIFIDGIKLAKYDAQFTSAKLLGTDSTGTTNDAEVAIEQAFTVDASGNVVNAEGTATPFCFKPELYLGETQVALTDITVYQMSKSNMTLNYSNGVFTLSKFTLNNGAPRTDYFIGLWIKYTDANSTVYYKYFGIRPQVTLATTA